MKHDATIPELEASLADIEHDIELLKEQIKNNVPTVHYTDMLLSCPKDAAQWMQIEELKNRRSDMIFQIERLKDEMQDQN